MTAFLRISLWLILSGLLFSPAEGVCLLPFPSEVNESEYEANTGIVRYQESVFRIEKPRNGSFPGHRPEQQSTPFVVDSSFFDSATSIYSLFGCSRSEPATRFHKQESLQDALTIRPPPRGRGTNGL
jgi:hypothetical protein